MSEIAKLRQQIDREIIAMKHAMHGYATVTRHDIITHHFANLETVYEQLVAEIGNVAAIQAISEKLEEVL
jgi:hypothetical protein